MLQFVGFYEDFLRTGVNYSDSLESDILINNWMFTNLEKLYIEKTFGVLPQA